MLVMELLNYSQVAVMLDTKGPEIRTGFLVEGKNVTVEKDSIVEITTDYSVGIVGDFHSRSREMQLTSLARIRTSPHR